MFFFLSSTRCKVWSIWSQKGNGKKVIALSLTRFLAQKSVTDLNKPLTLSINLCPTLWAILTVIPSSENTSNAMMWNQVGDFLLVFSCVKGNVSKRGRWHTDTATRGKMTPGTSSCLFLSFIQQFNIHHFPSALPSQASHRPDRPKSPHKSPLQHYLIYKSKVKTKEHVSEQRRL